MVIDLRGNPGGIGGMAMGMAGWLVDKPGQRLGTMYMRGATLNFVINPRAEAFNGPVAVLVDGSSASTSEIFAGGLKDLGRAVETQIVVEAETIFDVPANGIYYANLVVTGVPVIPPTKENSAKLLP
jgi:carboxyl-terminal processing protease